MDRSFLLLVAAYKTMQPQVSPELIWAITRDTSCHILKQRVSGRSGMGKRGAEFTKEPLNPTSRNAWKYSGLANPKAADVTATDGGCVLTTKTKNPKRAGKVSSRHTPEAAVGNKSAALALKRLCGAARRGRAPAAWPLGAANAAWRLRAAFFSLFSAPRLDAASRLSAA